MLLLPYFASSTVFGLRGYEISFLCKSLKITDMRNGLKSPKSGLKISQLGKYFFATGFFINPVAKKYRSNWEFFGGWKNCYKLITLSELNLVCLKTFTERKTL